MAKRTTKTPTTKTKTKSFPKHQYGMWERDGEHVYLVTRDSIDEVAEELRTGAESEVGVYELKEVVKVRRGAIVIEK